MKTTERLLLWLLLCIGSVALIRASIPNPAPVRLLFDYPTNQMDTELAFQLRGSPTVSQPKPWPVESVFPAANWFSNGVCFAPVVGTNFVLSITNQTTAGRRFWYVTASNFWGESGPSNVLRLPPVPWDVLNTRAEQGW